MFMNFITKSSLTSKEDLELVISHFNRCIKHKESHQFLSDKHESTKDIIEQRKIVSIPQVAECALDEQMLQDIYKPTQIWPLDANQNKKYRYYYFPPMQLEIHENQKVWESEFRHKEVFISERDEQDGFHLRWVQKPIFQNFKFSIPTESQCEGTFIYLSWIYMWCGTLYSQDENEKFFRLKQILQVISKLKADYQNKLGLDLFFLLIETCVNFGTLKMTEVIYRSLPSYELTPDSRIQSRYCFHMRKALKSQAKQENNDYNRGGSKSGGLEIQRNSQYASDQGRFGKDGNNVVNNMEKKLQNVRLMRKRTFREKGINQVYSNEVKLKLQEKCYSCNSQIQPLAVKQAIKNIMDNKKKTSQKILAICTYCGKEIYKPKLRAMIGNKVKKVQNTYVEEIVTFLTSQELFEQIEQLLTHECNMNLGLDKLRSDYKQLFWNLIYYFNDYTLPYDFLLPYEDDDESFEINDDPPVEFTQRKPQRVLKEGLDLDMITEVEESHEKAHSHIDI